jgi:hypothetical protein
MVDCRNAAAGLVDDGEMCQVVTRKEGYHIALGVDGQRRETQATALLSLVFDQGAAGVVRVLELELLVGLGLVGHGVALHVAGVRGAISQDEASRKGEREVELEGGGGGGGWTLMLVHLKDNA